MLTKYVTASMDHATIEWLEESQEFYGEIPGLPGVWASGPTKEACREELRSVLEDWIAVGLSFGHRIPEVDGIDINVESVR
jgi:predicted RNase H-like HicB family nuclease